MPEGAEPAVSRTHLHDVLLRERRTAPKARKGVADGNGIVQRTERIAKDLEAGVGEPFADLVGKAAAQDGDFVAVSDGHGRRIQGDGSLEFHERKLTQKKPFGQILAVRSFSLLHTAPVALLEGHQALKEWICTRWCQRWDTRRAEGVDLHQVVSTLGHRAR